MRRKLGRIQKHRGLSRGACVAAILLALTMMAPTAIATFPGKNGNIAFTRSTKGQADIWVFNARSGDKRRLTDTPRRNESMPDWNADGTRLAFNRCGLGQFSNCDIWVMDADGSNEARLTSTEIAQETWPTWSPDGTQIAYTSNEADAFQDIWVMNADGTDPTLLTPGVEVFDAFPEWSPDGTKIAFTSDREEPDDIWVMNADGSDLVRLTTGGTRIDERPDWSPDGTQIIFSRNGNIWVMDADGGNETKLTSNKRHEFNPTFSPNGRLISYNREGKDGRFGVWAMRTDGSAVKQRTFGLFDFFPDWQPAAPSAAE